ncbi:DEAD/DEAH box helicase [Saccharicrinis fermentans]|uniref:ATP-dependent RNA helicase RhlE n=1 Tax=Saccharicrinis fermentans DSM 9555 = JCM 21142 TaxID=869213 RepID=W7Y3J5_9BACT|nr:DEAD/DEAH box helicase [Saccharicrinis fermentans]GAF02577.1 ATP-dependent RNA helicase RhlE [Saccharicrinis fermentans DSM 9555 = JCM 21142]
MKFSEFNLNTVLLNALGEMGLEEATPIQEKVFPVAMSGRDVVGIAQTGTGKTISYVLPLLRNLKFSKQKHPRVLVLVPTRELVEQVAGEFQKLTEYMNVRIVGVYGGTNINTQKQLVYAGLDVLVATPGRLIDLALTGTLRLKSIQKLVIDEVDEMLNLGFRPQLERIIDLLPERRQNLMFSATLTFDVETIINDFFYDPIKVEVAATGKPLDKIFQSAYEVPNFYTKINLLLYLLDIHSDMDKVLVFVKSRAMADLLFAQMEEIFEGEVGVIHSNKSQNFRFRMVQEFTSGKLRLLIATDIIARGLDISNVSHVVNFDMPEEPEAYMHRIGRTGRAEAEGSAISFVEEDDVSIWSKIQKMMDVHVDLDSLPQNVEVSELQLDSEIPEIPGKTVVKTPKIAATRGTAFHEKKEKNKKINEGGSYRRKLAAKYKKPKTRGQKRK